MNNKLLVNLITLVIAISAFGCQSVDRVKVANTLHQADSYAAVVQAGLTDDDPLLVDVIEIRTKAVPVITAVDAWAASDGATNPAQDIWSLLDATETILERHLEGDRLMTAKRVLLGIRLGLLSSGLTPPAVAPPVEGGSE